MTRKQKKLLYRIIAVALLSVMGIIVNSFLPTLIIPLIIFIAAAVLGGYDVFINAANNLIHGHMLDENLLMTLGATGAFVLGEYTEGVFILLLYQIGELFQAVAVGKSRKSISSLMDIRPDYANKIVDGGTVQVDPYELEIGDTIEIIPGEKIPVDCVVKSGNSLIDTSALTGESLPQYVKAGDELLSSSINLSSALTATVSKTFDKSTVAKILEMVENATSKKSRTENFVTAFAKYYTPIVVALALLLLIVPSLIWGDVSVWLYRSIMFLVISCPCALVVSVPLAFFGAIGGASKIGVLVKGSNYLEALSHAKTIVFDKTGTLTKGNFAVQHIDSKIEAEKLLKLAAVCEHNSPHPIAVSIKKECDVSEELKHSRDHTVINGKGVSCIYKEKLLLAGNRDLMRDHNIPVPATEKAGTVIYIAYDNEYLGLIVVGDQIKPTSKHAISSIKKSGIKTVLLTGDRESIGTAVGKELGIDYVKTELLPNEKVAELEKIIDNSWGKVIYVGDGINDAPVLARADIGISMGAIGSDAAVEASDIVIMNDDISLLPTAIKISRRALGISKQNIVFALTVKFLWLILAALGLSNVMLSVFADVGVLIIAVLNSMRTLSVIK